MREREGDRLYFKRKIEREKRRDIIVVPPLPPAETKKHK